MGVEINQDSPTILTGFKGGAAELSRTGLPPTETLDIGNSEDRQRVFYKNIASLGTGGFLFTNWWQPNGAAATLIGEFEVAAISNPGKVAPEVVNAYNARIKSYMALMATWSMISHSDGALTVLPNFMSPPEVGDATAWNKKKSDEIAADPAVGFVLNWIEDWADDGVLFETLRKEKESPGSMAKWQAKVAEMLKTNPDWIQNRADHSIASDIEDSVVTIALTYFLVEDLPVWCEVLEKGYVFPDSQGTGIQSQIDVSKPDLGVLPTDEIFWHGLAHPTDILEKVKGVFLNPSLSVNGKSLMQLLDGALTFNGNGLKGKGRDIKPSDYSIKDLKRYGAMWDVMIGGTQGSSLSDFSKVGEGVGNLCNLYNPADYGGMSREEGVGWVVGELLAAKVLATIGPISKNRFNSISQLITAITGDPQRVKEVESLAVALLGSDLKGENDGLIASLERQYTLNLRTEELNTMIDVLRLGIRDPDLVAIMNKSGLGKMLGLVATTLGIASDLGAIANPSSGGGKGKRR